MLAMINNKARSQESKCNIESNKDDCGDSVVGQLM
jgi:hypothetical protein